MCACVSVCVMLGVGSLGMVGVDFIMFSRPVLLIVICHTLLQSKGVPSTSLFYLTSVWCHFLAGILLLPYYLLNNVFLPFIDHAHVDLVS